MKTDKDYWAMFAAACMGSSHEYCRLEAPALADMMLKEMKRRFPDSNPRETKIYGKPISELSDKELDRAILDFSKKGSDEAVFRLLVEIANSREKSQ